MSRPTLAPILIAALLAALPLSAGTVPADTHDILVEGRAAGMPEGALGLGFPGVTLHWRYHGAALSLNAEASSDDVHFDVSVDGAAPTLLMMKKGTFDYPIAAGVRTGDHEVSLSRRTESWQGTCTLKSLNLGKEGRLLAPPTLPKRKLLFVGDSITCGEIAGWTPGVTNLKDPLLVNADIAYAKLAARALDAQCSLVSYGGKGIIRDWQGTYRTINAPDFYERAMPDSPRPKWDPALYVPDAIGILLGTNDFNQGIPDQNQFVNAYVEFLRVLRRDAPHASIFLIESPMVHDDDDRGPRRTALNGYLQRILEKFDDEHAFLVPLDPMPGVPNNGHPTADEHKQMAKVVASAIREKLGW